MVIIYIIGQSLDYRPSPLSEMVHCVWLPYLRKVPGRYLGTCLLYVWIGEPNGAFKVAAVIMNK